MTMLIDNLFPTPIGRFELPDSITKKEFEYIAALPRCDNQGNETSTNNYLLREPELKRLSSICEQAAHDFFQKVYAPKNIINLYMTQSWANYTQPNRHHHKHLHDNSIISGVLYVSTDEATDRIYFYKDKQTHWHIPSDNYNPWNSEQWWYPVKSNTLLLFPSYLTHMVLPKQTPGTRISISFNSFFKGMIGDQELLSKLIL
jgi:uncharacterized protein (TIGR02466 family)